MVVVGTRPEAIKMAPVLVALQKHCAEIRTRLLLTGQHREIVDQVLNAFGLHADIDLDLMERSQTLGHFASKALEELGAVLCRERPDLVLVEGDTTTAFVASLAAFYQGSHVGHVEAGLRTRDKGSPFPEEMNRRLVGALAYLHFAPTLEAHHNLRREDVDESRIFVTGNPVVDALFRIRGPATAAARGQFPFLGNGCRTLLVTAHRRENHGEPLQRICRAVSRLVDQHSDLQIIWPVHPNPNVSPIVYDRLGSRERIHLTKPASYSSFIGVMALCTLVLTDSGGVQEEAPALGKPVLVMRDTTERPEGLTAGVVKLVGTDEREIVDRVSELLVNETRYREMSRVTCPYGDGRAAERIVAAIHTYYGLGSLQQHQLLAPSEVECG
jgi:UDP-N-acetylglucosamine 2-epimerase (non-hydrolysing)